MNRCQQEYVQDRGQKSNQKSVHVLTDISPNNLRAFFEATV
jgi:hypothetical protein